MVTVILPPVTVTVPGKTDILTMNRTVLIIAYHYPPSNNGGVARPVRLAKYLPRYGWKPVILSCGKGGDRGPSGEKVLRAAEPFAWRRPAGASPASAGTGLLKRLLKKYFLVPDGKRLWLRPAVAAAENFIRSENVDCIVSTSPPETSHLVAGRLKSKSGIPWLADFRDGWTFEPPRNEFPASRRRSSKMLKMESRTLAWADAITSATLPIHQDFLARYPAQRERLHYLPNGFDPETERKDASLSSVKPLRFLYTGRFSLSSEEMTPEYLFEGLRIAVAKEPALARTGEFILMGQFTDGEKALANGLEDVVNWRPFAGQSAAIALQHGATVNVLVTSRARKSVATGKVYEYLAARRPILALAEGNEAERIVRETDSGLCVPPDDANRVSEAILRLLKMWKEGSLENAFSFRGIEKFSYENICRDFAAILNDVSA